MKLTRIITVMVLCSTFAGWSFSHNSLEMREVAQYKSEDEAHNHAQTFAALMAASTEAERSRNFTNYLDRQKSFFYIAQQLLFQFDEALDVIYNKKQSGEQLTLEELTDFQKARFQNLIAWEFSERNLHEMLDLYYLALKHANDNNSAYQKSSQWIVTNVKKWVDAVWKKGDRSAMITLANHLQDINVQVGAEQAGVKAPSFAAYANPSQAVLREAYKRSKWLTANRKKSQLDSSLEKEWSAYLQQRSAEELEQFIENNNPARLTQALDELYPSADGKGHVTGNRFPSGKWAMTFDDGPSTKHTEGMVNNLKNNGVHGTFFWQTQNVLKYIKYPAAKSSLYSRALHSYTHANLPKQSAAGLDKEINQAVIDFAKVVGEKPTLFRCPYGSCGPSGGKIRQMIAKNDMLHIGWNVDTLDWQDKNPDSIYERTKKQIDSLGRGIVLFHDIHPQSVIASDRVIKYLKAKYKVEPLHKLIEESRGKPYYTP